MLLRKGRATTATAVPAMLRWLCPNAVNPEPRSPVPSTVTPGVLETAAMTGSGASWVSA